MQAKLDLPGQKRRGSGVSGLDGRRAGPGFAAAALLDWPARAARSLSSDDRAALTLWTAAYAALLVLDWAAAWTFRTTSAHGSLTGGFQHWDANWLQQIAQFGYFGPHLSPASEAFFPGYPLALALAHLVLRNWVLAELVVSAVAGCFAVVSLARLAGRRAVGYMLAAPAAVFLLVGYSEGLFLALAIPAWSAARRDRWRSAAVLAGLAGLVRPDALFLIPALAVMALISRAEPAGAAGSDVAVPPARPPMVARFKHAAIVCCALASPAAYLCYLRVTAGSWRAWFHAQQVGWDLHLTTPAQALRLTWWAAFEHPFSAGYGFEFQLELAAMAAMVLAFVCFAARRRWPEAVYCGLPVIALGTSTWYQTCPRTLLLLFPVWIALAGLELRWRWTKYAYFAVSAPLAVVLALLYLSGQWAG
jgi:hypothetical protein